MTSCINGCFARSWKWLFSSAAIMEMELQNKLSGHLSTESVSVYLFETFYMPETVPASKYEQERQCCYLCGPFSWGLENCRDIILEVKWNISALFLQSLLEKVTSSLGARTKNIELSCSLWSGIQLILASNDSSDSASLSLWHCFIKFRKMPRFPNYRRHGRVCGNSGYIEHLL